jgi:hypothetical protein
MRFRVEKEIESITYANLSLLKDKYQRKKKKLLQLVKELHLRASDVRFVPK